MCSCEAIFMQRNCNYTLARWIGDNEDHHNHNHHKHPTHNKRTWCTRGFPISIQASFEIKYKKQTVSLGDI